MFLLRRAAVRAINATPNKALLAKPRSITTFSPSPFRPQQQKWSITFQKRFASDEAAKTDENFAQTAAEAPMEDGLTPAPQEEQTPPAGAQSTAAGAANGTDAMESLEAAAQAVPGLSRARREDKTPPNKVLYIGNLYYEVSVEQLKKVFSRFGEVTNVRIVYDNRGLSRGFGYVEFENVEDAQNAIANLDMQLFEGRNLVVQNHRPKSNAGGAVVYAPSVPSNTLFIGNMSFEMSDKDLNDLFRDIRNVMDVRVAIDRRTGQPRGFAHADFIDVASATKAKQILESKVIYGRELRVDFSKSTAIRKDKREDSGTGESGPKNE